MRVPTCAAQHAHPVTLTNRVNFQDSFRVSEDRGPTYLMAAQHAHLCPPVPRLPSPQLSVEERRLLMLSALLLPLRKLQYKFKNKQAPATGFIIRESIKWRTKDVDGVALLHAQVAELAAVHRELAGTGM